MVIVAVCAVFTGATRLFFIRNRSMPMPKLCFHYKTATPDDTSRVGFATAIGAVFGEADDCCGLIPAVCEGQVSGSPAQRRSEVEDRMDGEQNQGGNQIYAIGNLFVAFISRREMFERMLATPGNFLRTFSTKWL